MKVYFLCGSIKRFILYGNEKWEWTERGLVVTLKGEDLNASGQVARQQESCLRAVHRQEWLHDGQHCLHKSKPILCSLRGAPQNDLMGIDKIMNASQKKKRKEKGNTIVWSDGDFKQSISVTCCTAAAWRSLSSQSCIWSVPTDKLEAEIRLYFYFWQLPLTLQRTQSSPGLRDWPMLWCHTWVFKGLRNWGATKKECFEGCGEKGQLGNRGLVELNINRDRIRRVNTYPLHTPA